MRDFWTPVSSLTGAQFSSPQVREIPYITWCLAALLYLQLPMLFGFKGRDGYCHPRGSSKTTRRRRYEYERREECYIEAWCTVLCKQTHRHTSKHFNIFITYLNIYWQIHLYMHIYKLVCVVSLHSYSKDIHCSSKHWHENRQICIPFP